MLKRCALFLDRDGVLIEDDGYICSPKQVRLLPGVAEALARVNRSGVPVIIITNQSGIARGWLSENDLQAIHARLDQLLADAGAYVDRYYYCPHHPEFGQGEYRQRCGCRKPAPGLLLQAARDFSLDLGHSFFVGDRLSDLQAGAAAGCHTILVRTGLGHRWPEPVPSSSLRLALIAENLTQAVDYCLPYLLHRHWQLQAA